jgi:adenylate kinase family enzyme
MIIHISGSSGSGKTYIGNLFKNTMNVIDTDDWNEEYNKIKNKTKKSFINFIQNKINNLDKNKINLLVGYLDFYINNKLIIFPIITKYKFYIKIIPKKLFIQYNSRIINWICKNKEEALSKINNYKLLPFRTLDEIEKQYNNDYNDYVVKLKYKLYSQNKIIKFLEKQLL